MPLFVVRCAGDLEGATIAMQEATRQLVASEVECSSLRHQLAAKQRLQQQLEFDVAYLRSRRAPAAPAAAAGTAAVDAAAAACIAREYMASPCFMPGDEAASDGRQLACDDAAKQLGY